MKRRRMQYAVIGLGRFGTSVATRLCDFGHEVMAVDISEAAVNDIAPYVTQAVQADAATDGILVELGIREVDAAIVCIGASSRSSIMVTVLCKEAGVPMVIAKAEDDLHARILRKVGADRVVFPERDMGERLARSLDAPNILDTMELPSDYRIAEMAVPQMWCGKTLEEISVRRKYGLTIIGIHRSREFIASPGAEVFLYAGDSLVVLGKQKDIESAEGE